MDIQSRFQLLKLYARFILIDILCFFTTIIPKDKNKILFISFPDYSDNAKYVYQYIIEHDSNKKLIWAVKNKIDADFVIRGTISYYYHLLTAGYLISTHGMSFKSHNQKLIQLWHGIPLKKIGHYLEPKRCSEEMAIHSIKKTDIFVATSELTKMFFSSIFQLKPTKIQIFGLPRCDVLYQDYSKSRKVLNSLLETECNCKKIVFYAPTYRTSPDAMNTSAEIIKSLVNNKKLAQFLHVNDILFLCKLHPIDEISQLESTNNIKILPSSSFEKNNYTIYDFLNLVDLLITDYSSIYFDYLHVNRPIIFYVPDLEDYINNRGFFLHPFEDWTPGDKTKTVEHLIESLYANIFVIDQNQEKRERIKRLMFTDYDDKSSYRVWKSVFNRELELR